MPPRLRLLAAIGSVTVALATTACSSGGGHGGAASATSADTPVPANVIAVPLVRQQTSSDAGDAVTLAVLRYWKFATYGSTDETSLFQPLQTSTANGTEPYAIANYMNQTAGVVAAYKTGAQMSDLEAAIDRGEPVIVDFQAWALPAVDFSSDWKDGTYAVLVGYDAANLYFMDPFTSGHYAYVPRGDFAARWHDLVGDGAGVPTDHMAIFVQSTGTAHPAPVAPMASIMN